MKTFTFPELKKIANEQDYKLACLENSQGERLQLNNTLKTKIPAQLDLLDKRLKSEIYPDGLYYICMATTIHRAKNPDKYALVKGKITKEISEKNTTPVVLTKSEDVLSYTQALAMQQTISDLKAEVKSLQLEIEYYKKENNELQKELTESSLEEKPSVVSDVKTFLTESMPSVMAIADKYFGIEEKKLAIRDKELNLQGNRKVFKKDPSKRKLIEPGSDAHIALIHSLHKLDTDEANNKLDAELDKLEAVNEELYLKVCKDLDIEIEPNDNEN